jgi:hypothetical protein
MRRLHVVGQHEKFVASGVYRVLAGDEPTGLVEHWSIHEVGDGAQFIRVDIDGREFDGGSTLMEALLNPDGHFERVDEHLYEGQSHDPIKTSYTFFDNRVEILRTVKNDLYEKAVELPSGYGAIVESQVLTGFAVVLAVRNEDETPMFSLRHSNAEINWTIHAIKPQYVGQKIMGVSKQEVSVTGYRWGNEITIWQDQHGVTVSADTAESKTVLTQYARRPEPKLHD